MNLNAKILIPTLLLGLLFSSQSHALAAEFGVAYSYQKKSFSATNFYQSDSKSASVSVSLIEQLALEFTYTESFYESQEADINSTRTVQQKSQVTGADLIYVLTDRKTMVQPYLKAGVAYIQKKKQIRYLNADVIDIPTKDGMAPSYGAGVKVKLTENFAITLGYDVWNTPLDDGTKTDDTAFKAGLKWTP